VDAILSDTRRHIYKTGSQFCCVTLVVVVLGEARPQHQAVLRRETRPKTGSVGVARTEKKRRVEVYFAMYRLTSLGKGVQHCHLDADGYNCKLSCQTVSSCVEDVFQSRLN